MRCDKNIEMIRNTRVQLTTISVRASAVLYKIPVHTEAPGNEGANKLLSLTVRNSNPKDQHSNKTILSINNISNKKNATNILK